jgi:hypothetical protein
MGTRHLIAVQLDNKLRVAQYGQWDGYPEGQGQTVHKFLSKVNLDKFRKQVAKTYFIVDGSPISKKIDRVFNKYNKIYHKSDFDSKKAAAMLEPKDKFLYDLFTRDTGANILNVIYKATKEETIPLANNSDFAGDSLFCEWAYLINLDDETLEVYRGFNLTELTPTDRFVNAPLDHETYKQIKLLKTFKLKRLPNIDNYTKELIRLKNKRDKERSK